MEQLLPSPDVAQHLNFSGASIHSPSGCIPPLRVSHFISIPPRDFQHPGSSWCQAALPALVGQGAGDLTLLPVSCSRCWARGCSNLGPCTDPKHRTVPAQSPHHVFQCLQFLASKLHIIWDSICCSLCSSEDLLDVPPGHRGTGLHSHLPRCHLLLTRCVDHFF